MADGRSLLTVPDAHAGGVSALCLLQLKDGSSSALSGGLDGSLRVHCLQEGTLRCESRGAHAGAVTAVCCARDGTRAYSVGADGVARLLLVPSGLAAGPQAAWQAALAVAATVAPGDGPFTADQLSHDATVLFTATAGGAAHAWRAADLSALCSFWGHSGPVRCLALSQAHDSLVTASADGSVRLWRTAQGGAAAQVLSVPPDSGGDSPDEPTGLASTADAAMLYVAYASGALRCWRADGVCLRCAPPAAEGQPITALALSHAEDRLAVASLDGSIRLLRCSDLVITQTLVGHKQAVTCLAFAKDGSTVTAGGMEGILRIWRVGAAAPLFSRTACLTVNTRTPGCIPQNLSKVVQSTLSAVGKEIGPGSLRRAQAAAAVTAAVGAAQAATSSAAAAIAAAIRERRERERSGVAAGAASPTAASDVAAANVPEAYDAMATE